MVNIYVGIFVTVIIPLRYPNVINKKVWSEALSDWVRFNMTTAALRGIDSACGVDNYILRLDERSVEVSSAINECLF